MFVLQCAVALALWLACGYACFKKAYAGREALRGSPRGFRIIVATVLLLASTALLLAGLIFALGQAGTKAASLSPLAWLTVALTGAVFVGAQTVSASLLMTLIEGEPVTPQPAQASQGKNQSDPS